MYDLMSFFINIKNYFYKLTVGDVDLIKKSQLFFPLPKESFAEMIKTTRMVLYPAGKVIFREGDPGTDLYVIAEGFVKVFKQDKEINKIPLAMLTKGDFFGEQALINPLFNKRNASVEAITEVKLLKIDQFYLRQSLLSNETLKEKLIKVGYEQLIRSFSLTNDFYKFIQEAIAKVKYPAIVTLKKGENIFNYGDEPDNLYFILNGKVMLEFPGKNMQQLLLENGHFFGELSIINQKRRAATAVAYSDVRLLAIAGDLFKECIQHNPYLSAILFHLQNAYKIPIKGRAEAYFGSLEDLGPALTIRYWINNKEMLFTQLLSHSICMMFASDEDTMKEYHYQDNARWITLAANNDRIIGIKILGSYVDLPFLCRLLLEEEHVDDYSLSLFELTGVLNPYGESRAVKVSDIQEENEEMESIYQIIQSATQASPSVI